ncbi:MULTISPECIES: hypothetical protein [unclassified Sporolactobacillus]|uniref:hypothetical protein n=1 Tax=unclassified Sporolactobacillus TaxID=2628533 RepID=UPI002368A999|nr:hypothetical protein [Sporolactobacillus sp. CQH2019]MDD9147254.1 hypothetical protein [Sporolactobacillus sp. CQH2019]
MSEDKKKEPKTIHVDKLVIKADEVIFQPERENRPFFGRPGFQGPDNERGRVARDFWGFPLPRTAEETEEPKEEKHETEE